MAKSKTSKKKITARQFAPIALWLAGVALLATVILLAFKLLASAGLYLPSNAKQLNLFLLISTGVVILGLALFALLDPQRVREFLTGRQARYGSNAIIMLIASIGILVVVNLIVFQSPVKPLDLTEDKSNSLAPETMEVLKSLSAPVQATAFFTSQSSTTTAAKLLANYKAGAGGKFDYKFVDPDQNPVLAQQAGISGDGKIYLQMGDAHEIVAYASEQDITAALIRLINPGQRVIYFLTGHGERDIEQASNTSYTQVKAALEAKNYTVLTLNLVAEHKVPDDAKAIIIAGPLQPLTTDEVTLLQGYVATGGALIVMEEPLPMTQFGDTPDPLADYLATSLGITLNNDVVIDTNSSQTLYAVAAMYSSHPITEKLQGVFSYYPTARSLSATPEAKTQPVQLAATATGAWGETDFEGLANALQGNGQISFDQGIDISGPLTLAMAVSDATTGSNVVVFGDSDFASDQFFSQYANGDMLINAIDWAAGQEKQLNLTSPQPITRSLNPISSLTFWMIALSLVILLPGLVIASGITSWVIRRSRG
jgi:ABC-type uncharacterized transport system involved in gliding motility auxiliary subunit